MRAQECGVESPSSVHWSQETLVEVAKCLLGNHPGVSTRELTEPSAIEYGRQP